MKLILSILIPSVYEYIGPDTMESVTFISYPDLTPGASEVREVYKNSDLWRSSKCMGLNFKNILEENGYNIDDYERDCSYTLNTEATKALLSDLPQYENVKLIIGKEPDFSDIFDRNTIYEFTKRDTQDSILLLNPKFEKMDLEVLPCIPYESYELEVSGQDAIDYFTKESIYIVKESQFQEVLQGFPNLPDDLKNLDFKEGHYILRWEGVMRDNEKKDKPWRIKLENLKNDIDKVLDSNICVYLKNIKIKKIIKKYYGNI